MVVSRDARTLSADALYELRLSAVSMVLEEGMTRKAAAKVVGVVPAVVGKWVKLYEEEGASALRPGKRGRPENTGRLSVKQQQKIIRQLDKSPSQHLLPFALWSREAVKQLIEKLCNVTMTLQAVGNYLKKWGFTAKKPVRLAYERSEKKVQKWLDEEYPAIAERAKRDDAVIFWLDEAGFSSSSFVGKAFAPKGQRAKTKKTAKRFRINMISAIANSGQLEFKLFDGRFNSAVLTDFLEGLSASVDGRKIIVVMDGHPVHRSYAVRDWVAEQEAIELEFLPPYAPDLNPDELLNHDVKANAVGRKRARTKDVMVNNIDSHLQDRKRDPDVVRGFFMEENVAYAAADPGEE